MKIATLALAFLIATAAWGDTSVQVSTGAASPTTCTPGDLFYDTSIPGLRTCSATNTWVTMLAPGGSVALVVVFEQGGETVTRALTGTGGSGVTWDYVRRPYHTSGVQFLFPGDFLDVSGMEHHFAVIAKAHAGETITFRLRDVTNGQTLATTPAISSTTYTATSTDTFSNFPAGPAEIRLEYTTSGPSTDFDYGISTWSWVAKQ